MRRVLLLTFAFTFALAASADARSEAANRLIAQEIAEACGGQGGRIDPAAVVERDVTDDGRTDLIISHEGIRCAGGGESSMCGQLCSIIIFVHRGQLMERAREMLGRRLSVGGGAVPLISMHGMGGRPGAIRWNGQTFGPAK